MTWLGADATRVANTLLSGGSRTLTWIEGYSHDRIAENFGTVVQNNLCARTGNGTPPMIMARPMMPGNNTLCSSLGDIAQSSGQEPTGLEFRATATVARSLLRGLWTTAARVDHNTLGRVFARHHAVERERFDQSAWPPKGGYLSRDE